MSILWPANYRRGLDHIKTAIEQSLASAGANLSISGIHVSGGAGPAMPPKADIAAVPFDAPRILVRFTQQEILDSCDGVRRADVREKIGRYPSVYASFRKSPERSMRSPPAHATVPAGASDAEAE